MSRINTNVGAMLAQRVLANQNQQLSMSLERLSTGLRINRGYDDPAGLIASENLRAEKSAIESAINNASRAGQVINVAEGGLQEISSLLVELQGLVSESSNAAGLSDAEREANQIQVDSILETIDRIANSTNFNGTKLLNGEMSYALNGVDASDLSGVDVTQARLSGAPGATFDVTVNVEAAATQGTVYIDMNAVATDSATFEVSGVNGVQQFTFAAGSSAADMATAINSFSDALGVTADATDPNFLAIDSSGYGDDAWAKVQTVDGASGMVLDASDGSGTAADEWTINGTDAQVNINGTSAIVNGLTARIATSGFDVSVDLAEAFNVDASTTTFAITGGGASFNIAPEIGLASHASIGISSMTTANLGGTWGALSDLSTGGSSDLSSGNLDNAQRVVEESISSVASTRGRLGAFQKHTLGSSINSLGVALENTASAESQIRETDFAYETAELTRAQIMTQAATQALQIAKSTPMNVLSLLSA